MRSGLLWKLCPRARISAGVSVAVFTFAVATSQPARAFGGLWSSPGAPVRQASEAILFVDNPDSTITVIVQLKVTGPTQHVAWVIPVPGRPKIGLSSNTVFERLDTATEPQYWREVAVEGKCKKNARDAVLAPSSGTTGVGTKPERLAASIGIVQNGSAGSFDYVNIRVDPSLGDPAKAATDWLKNNGYDTSVDAEVLGPYLKSGLGLVAFKLSAGTDASATRPVALTYEGKLLTIPLRPTAIAARMDMGILVWVIGRSQAVPTNYRTLAMDDAPIDWLTAQRFPSGTLPGGGVGPGGAYGKRPSNYDALVTKAADEAGGRGFVTELAGPASQYRDKVWSSLDEQQFATMSSEHYADGIDAVVAARVNYAGWDGWDEAIRGATALPSGATFDEFARDPGRYRGVAKVDTGRFMALLRDRVVKPVADTARMFYRAPYLTRLYTTMSPSEMTVDPTFDYDFDRAEVSNVHVAKQTIKCRAAMRGEGPTAPWGAARSPPETEDEAPWRIQLPHGGAIAGSGSTGAAHRVTPDRRPLPPTAVSPTPRSGRGCRVSCMGASRRSALAACLSLAIASIAARRRRYTGRRTESGRS